MGVDRTGSKTGSEELAELLREAREAKRLSRREVADATGLSYPYISQLETGYRMPSSRALLDLAGALEVDPAVLLESMGEPDASPPRSARSRSRRSAEAAASPPLPPGGAAWVANPRHDGPGAPTAATVFGAAPATTRRGAPAPVGPAAGGPGPQDAVRAAVTALEALPVDQRLGALAGVQEQVVRGVVRDSSVAPG